MSLVGQALRIFSSIPSKAGTVSMKQERKTAARAAVRSGWVAKVWSADSRDMGW